MHAIKKGWAGSARFLTAFPTGIQYVLHINRLCAPIHGSSVTLGYQRSQSRRLFVSHARCASYSTVAQQRSRDDSEEVSTSDRPLTSFMQLGEQGLVSQVVIDTLVNQMRMVNLTDVQSLTISQALTGKDMVAQARTGTGKTLAFLIPIVQTIINQKPKLQERPDFRSKRLGSDIRAIIISPTRELAEQIATEARRLVQNTGIIVRTAVGGSSKRRGLQLIHQNCNILVGTPGRLKDILSDEFEGIKAPNLSILVLDEADRLLEQGFEQEIRDIQRYLPDKTQFDRQTLLYSATISQSIIPVVKSTMKKGFQFVKTVQEGEELTHERVEQRLVNVGSLANQTLTLAELCLREINSSTAERPFKAIVFYSTLSEVALESQVLARFRPPRTGDNKPGIPYSTKIIGLSSKLSQKERTHSAESFKKASSAILLSSDVAARGMDFPGVTHVIQMGMPPSEEQYLHRIGRTARAGQSGEAWLLVSKLDIKGIRARLPRMPLRLDESLESPKVDLGNDSNVPSSLEPLITRLRLCHDGVADDLKLASYKTSLGMFGHVSNKQAVVDAVNFRATHGLGLARLPLIPQARAAKLGLLNLKGLQIGRDPSDRRDSGSHGRSSRPGSPYIPSERIQQRSHSRRGNPSVPYSEGSYQQSGSNNLRKKYSPMS